jgi:cytochrome c-type biogenesis protein CcmE
MKKAHIVIIILIAVSIGAILSTVADSSTYADFSEAFNNQGKEYHVVGHVNFDKPLIYEPEKNANVFSFFMKDLNGVERFVMLNATKPQDFEMSEQVVITGEARDTFFMADKILMKCPSKYNNTDNPDVENKEM